MSSLVDATVDLAVAGYRGYLNVFAASPVAQRLSPAAPVRRSGYDIEVEVTDHEVIADGVAQVTFARAGRTDGADGTALPAWTPGAHLDVFLPSGTQRQYSLCGDPQDEGIWRVGVLLDMVEIIIENSGAREVVKIFEEGGEMLVMSVITLSYAIVSGLWGVMVTDMIQFGVAMAGSIFAAVYALRRPEVGGLADGIARTIQERTGKECRSLVLGHLQRGGQPTAVRHAARQPKASRGAGLPSHRRPPDLRPRAVSPRQCRYVRHPV